MIMKMDKTSGLGQELHLAEKNLEKANAPPLEKSHLPDNHLKTIFVQTKRAYVF